MCGCVCVCARGNGDGSGKAFEKWSKWQSRKRVELMAVWGCTTPCHKQRTYIPSPPSAPHYTSWKPKGVVRQEKPPPSRFLPSRRYCSHRQRQYDCGGGGGGGGDDDDDVDNCLGRYIIVAKTARA